MCCTIIKGSLPVYPWASTPGPLFPPLCASGFSAAGPTETDEGCGESLTSVELLRSGRFSLHHCDSLWCKLNLWIDAFSDMTSYLHIQPLHIKPQSSILTSSHSASRCRASSFWVISLLLLRNQPSKLGDLRKCLKVQRNVFIICIKWTINLK